jgi:uncharacterized repeat protein (TIGR01451 family)
MARCARHHWRKLAFVTLVIATALALGLMPGTASAGGITPTPSPTPTDTPTSPPTTAPTDTPINSPTETATTVPPPPPLLTISKVADNANISAGDPIGFTITVTSPDTGDATNVTVHDFLFDVLPSQPGTTDTAWTETTGNQFCNMTPSGDFNCQFGNIASGAPPITLHLTAPTTEQDCGTVENGARLEDDFQITSVSASVTINCPTSTPAVTSTAEPTETALPTTEVPTGTPAATATSDTTGGVTDLPNTGSSPGSGSGRTGIWLLLALLAVTGIGIGGVRARRAR